MQVTKSKKQKTRSYRHSSSFKMALFFTFLLGISASILGYFIYTFNQHSFIRETEAAIDARIENIVLWEKMPGNRDIGELINAFDNSDNAATSHYYLMTPDEKKLAGDIDALPDKISALSEGLISFSLDDRDFAAKIHTFPNGNRLLVARDIHDLQKTYARIQILSGITITLMLVVIGTSFLISTFVVGRSNDIAATAQQIMETGDLSRRISVATGWDDLSFVADVLNALLERIEDLMQGIRHVSDNIAHDLRTPLTRLKNKLDDLAAGKAATDIPELHADILSLTAEADRILATFNALLRIANIEKGQNRGHFTKIDWSALLQDVTELYEPLAEEKNLRIETDISVSAEMQGDRDLLFQSLANLLDNAIKFTPPDGTIRLTLAQTETEIAVTVTDSGSGAAPDELKHLFDRFYRGEKSRHTPGSGLGLSLVAAVASLHKGQAMAKNIAQGFEVSMHFPRT